MSNLRIANVEPILLSYRYTDEEMWKWSGGATRQRNAVLVRITTDNGIIGVGRLANPPLYHALWKRSSNTALSLG